MAFAWRRFVLGRPLPTAASKHERLSRPRALGAFGLDALSSVAYGPDEILYVLVLAGTAGLQLAMPIALAIAVLLAVVVTSYRQTNYAYPQGGGSYTVARENLGTLPGLVAAAALMVDYMPPTPHSTAFPSWQRSWLETSIYPTSSLTAAYVSPIPTESSFWASLPLSWSLPSREAPTL